MMSATATDSHANPPPLEWSRDCRKRTVNVPQFNGSNSSSLDAATLLQDERRVNAANVQSLADQKVELGVERDKRLEAERIGKIKDEFLANLSHEIRAPLNAILGWACFLTPGKSTAAQLAEGLDVIRRNARAQARLIVDLLDMSCIVSG